MQNPFIHNCLKILLCRGYTILSNCNNDPYCIKNEKLIATERNIRINSDFDPNQLLNSKQSEQENFTRQILIE